MIEQHHMLANTVVLKITCDRKVYCRIGVTLDRNYIKH